MVHGLPLGRLFGIQIFLDWSWVSLSLLALPATMLALHAQALDPWGIEVSVWVSCGVLAAALGSVLFHHGAHVLMANLQDIAVQRVALYPFGEVSDAAVEPLSAEADIKIALAGPIASAVLASLLLVTAAAVNASGVLGLFIETSDEPLRVLLGWAVAFNLFLTLINLIPAAPLDASLLLRALLRRQLGDLQKAQRVVCALGIAFGLLLLGAALYAAAFTDLDPLLRVTLALCLVILGWSIKTAAQAQSPVAPDNPFADARVGDFPLTHPTIVSPHLTIQQLVDTHILGTTETSFVVLRGDTLEGMLWLDDVWQIPKEQWKRVLVKHVMTLPERMVILKPSESAANLPERLARRHNRPFPVIENLRFLGLLEREGIDKWLAQRRKRGILKLPRSQVSHSLRH